MKTDMLNTETPTATPLRLDLGLAVLHVVVGVVFLVHGYQKLFVMGMGGAQAFLRRSARPCRG